MAEGWANSLQSDKIQAFSAGIEKHGLNSNAVKVMAEAGVDISMQSSKTLADLPDVKLDWVITVCGHADENCPIFPGPVRKFHRGFDDPPKLAANARTESEALSHYRRVRDEIKAFVEKLPEILEDDSPDTERTEEGEVG
jgi:arsenate reductase